MARKISKEEREAGIKALVCAQTDGGRYQQRERTAELDEATATASAESERIAEANGEGHWREYRQQGLPITSTLVESTIKQINRRIKGTEKFWDEGADPMLQLVADRLSQTNAAAQFWSRRLDRLINPASYHQAT